MISVGTFVYKPLLTHKVRIYRYKVLLNKAKLKGFSKKHKNIQVSPGRWQIELNCAKIQHPEEYVFDGREPLIFYCQCHNVALEMYTLYGVNGI